VQVGATDADAVHAYERVTGPRNRLRYIGARELAGLLEDDLLHAMNDSRPSSCRSRIPYRRV
jgi:hypothetical protein